MKSKGKQQGSVILLALIVAVIVGTVCACYLQTAESEFRLSMRSVNYNRALNLAESGADRAMLAANSTQLDAAHGWTQISSGAYTKTCFPASQLTFGDGTTGQIYIRVDNPSSNAPQVTAMGVITTPTGQSIRKQVRIDLKRSGYFPAALVSKNGIVMNGNNPTVDSYDSDLGPPDPNTNHHDKATIAAVNGGIQLNNANVFGHVAVGGSSKNAVQHLPNASLTNSSTPAGTQWDDSLITTDISMNLPPAPLPPQTDGAPEGMVFTPSKSNGKNSDQTSVNDIGIPGSTSPSYYYVNGNLDLSGQEVININGPTVLAVYGELSTNGQAQIVVNSSGNASLTLYVTGNINVSGNGFVNQNPSARKLIIYGEGSAGQNISISGNGATTAVFYGPDDNVNLNGNAIWDGAIVGNTLNLSGNAQIHYDEKIGALSGSSNIFQVSSWEELDGPPGSATAMDTRAPFNF